MRFLILLAALGVVAIKASPIDDLRKQLTKIENDLQTEIQKNNKKIEQLEDIVKDNHHNGLRERVEKLEKQVRKLKSRVTSLEEANAATLSVMPYLTKAVGELTITLNQQEFTRLVSLIPLQSISPNITVNGATYTVELSNILNALTAKMLNILAS